MRQKLCLILCSFISTWAFSQNKGDNTIVVRNVSFDHIVRTLIDNNYPIDKKDTVYKTIRTEKLIFEFERQIYFDIRVKGDSCIIKGNWIIPGNGFWAGEYKIENIGANKSDYKMAFKKMTELAKLIGSEIEFKKE